MKHKFIASLFGLMVVLPVVAPTPAQAQNFASVRGLTPFTPPANYMSLPGYVRWRYMLDSGRWLSRQEAVNAVQEQGVSARFDPTNWRYASLFKQHHGQFPGQLQGAVQPQHASFLERGF